MPICPRIPRRCCTVRAARAAPGHKGVSALIVAPAEFKKAQRLLQGAKVVAEWGKAPVGRRGAGQGRSAPAGTSRAGAGPWPTRRDMATALLDRFGAEQVGGGLRAAVARGAVGPGSAVGSRAKPRCRRRRASAANSAPRSGSPVGRPRGPGRGALAAAEDLRCRRHHQGRHRRDPRAGGRDLRADCRGLAGKFGARHGAGNRRHDGRMEGEPSMDRPERAPRKAPAARAPRAEKPPYEQARKAGLCAQAVASGRRSAVRTAMIRSAAATRRPAARRVRAPRARQALCQARGWRAQALCATRAEAAYGEQEALCASASDGDRKPYAPRAEAPSKALCASATDGERKPYAPRAEGRPSPMPSARMASASPMRRARKAAKPYAKREDGERKPYAPRADGAKPYAKREDGDALSRARPGSSRTAAARDKPARGGWRSNRTAADGKSFRQTGQRQAPARRCQGHVASASCRRKSRNADFVNRSFR